jgi:hypothetical protein
MLDLEELKIIAQLEDNLEVLSRELEKSFNSNNAEEFKKISSEILETKKKISEVLK